MLQHNVTPDATAARRAHAAHAAVVGAHLLCCGVPAALVLFAAGAGASIGLSAAQAWFGDLHLRLHAYEIVILALSAGFLLLGAWLEWRAYRGRRISAFFAASMLCFILNAGVIWTHRDAHAVEIGAASLLR